MDVVERTGATPPAAVTGQVCIGCHALESPAPCVGRCDDRRVVLVRAEAGEQVERLESWATARGHALEVLLRRIAELGAGDVEGAYRRIRPQARALLRDAPGEPALPDPEDVEIEAWWCATCGRVEALRPCLGICIRKRETLVRADRHEAAVAATLATRDRTRAMVALVREVGWSTPRSGHWQESGRALASRARTLLAAA